MRNIELFIDSEEFVQITHTVGVERLEAAIGYLSTRAIGKFPTVRIYKDHAATDLVAHYYNENGEYGYTIGAIWHGGHYGFHS